MLYLLLSLASADIIERMNNIRLGGGTLALSWTDCGTDSTHGTVTGLTPNTLTLGTKTTVTGTGNLDESTTGGTYAIVMKSGFIHENWSGDICQAKTFKLPLGMGSIVFDGMACPIAKGVSELSMDITMSSAIPSSLASATI